MNTLFFETIALVDTTALHLDYHATRLNRTRREVFGVTTTVDLADYLSRHEIGAVPPSVSHPQTPSLVRKLRLIYNGKGIQAHEVVPYVPKTIRTIGLTESSIDYRHKSTDRSAFDALLDAHALVDEVLITRDGYLRDTTIANVAFRKHGIWYTPDVPLLHGTTRARLIDRGALVPRTLHCDDIAAYDALALFNAMIGFVVFPLSILRTV
jgi:4-amino-4-deoxychorismate lyase